MSTGTDGNGLAYQGRARRRPTPADRTLTEIDLVCAIAESPALYALAQAIPPYEPGSPGRPPLYPAWTHIAHQMLSGLLGSHSKASRVMAHQYYWNVFRRSARKNGAPRARRQPPSHWHHTYFEHTSLDVHLEELLAIMRAEALRTARALGCLDPTCPYSHNSPSRGQYVIGDGKVISSPVRKNIAEKWRKERGAEIHSGVEIQNGEDGATAVYGSKFAMLHVRPDSTRNRRVILDVEPVPHGRGYGGEAAISLAMLERLDDAANGGVHGVCYDGAFHGKHRDPLMKRGLTVLSPIQRNLKPTPLEKTDCPCGDEHEIFLHDGTLKERTVTDDGEFEMLDCQLAKIMRRKNADHTWRWYRDSAASCGTIHRFRIDNTADDERTGFNRAQHFRQHPPKDPHSLHARAYGWREDSESLHNSLDRTLYGGRMIAHTARRQLAVMLGIITGRNSVAEWNENRSQREKP